MSRHLKFGFEVLRNGAVHTSLYSNDASISADKDAEIKTSLSGSFCKNDAVNFLTDWIRPYMVINGERKNLGMFLATTPEEDNGELEIEAYDKGIILKQNATENRLHIYRDTRYIDNIKNLLAQNGITECIMDFSDAVLLADREDWEIGTSYLTIINDLLSEINFNSIWFDGEGVARIERAKSLNTNRIKHFYKADELSFIRPDYTKTNDTFSSYNVFIATVDNPDYEETLIATAINDDPTSPISTSALGRRIVAPVESLNNIASQLELQEYVNSKMLNSKLTTDTVSFSTALNVHEMFEYVATDHSEISGIHQEQSWEMALDESDTMTHTARKVRNI